MSSMDFTTLDAEELKNYEVLFRSLLVDIFGSDIDLVFRSDGTTDIAIVGGDINLTGTASGNNYQDIMKLVRNRLHTRLLTYYSETPLLPSGYGSYLTDIIGVSITDDDNVVSSENIMSQKDAEGFIKGIIKYSLEVEPLVTEVINVDVNFREDNTISIDISFRSVFINLMSTNLQLLSG